MTSTFAAQTDIGEAALTVREAGSGQTVWYFHDELSVETNLVSDSVAESHRVLAPMHPGYGNAPRPSWVENVHDIADLYLQPVLASADGVRVSIVGSSIGAWIAAETALLAYERVERLVLIGPLGLRVPGFPPADHWFMRDDEREATLFADPANKPSASPDEFMANEAMTARLGWNPRFASHRLGPRLGRLRMPVLLVWGEQDALLPPEHREAWKAALPNCREVVIGGCGHYPVYEQSSEVASIIKDFLSERIS